MKVTLNTLQEQKKQGNKIAALTAYDASFASLIEKAGAEIILVGDTLGQVVQGFDSTVPVNIDSINYHLELVCRGTKNSFVIADMPFMSTVLFADAVKTAIKFMQTGANMVKIEGATHLELIKTLVDNGTPVCGHVGLTPQSVNVLGGYKVQGKTENEFDKIIEDAKSLEAAGVQLLVLECVPNKLAAKITSELVIPTIGIGAGPYTDGQILVTYDMLGITPNKLPKFVRKFLNQDNPSIYDALNAYVKAVKTADYPCELYSYA